MVGTRVHCVRQRTTARRCSQILATASLRALRKSHCAAPSRAAAASPKSVRAVFEFKVQNAAKSRGGYYLDSEKDFHSPANLGVMIRPSAMPELTKKYGDDFKTALVGKTVKIIGQVRRRVVAGGTATATQIEVTHAGQILSVS